jgi:hypothetical protein
VQEYLTIWDLVLTPFYLIMLGYIAKGNRNKRYSLNNPLRPYFLPGLYAKLAGAVIIGLIYAYYYKGGDTFNYFYHGKIINSALKESFNTWIKLIFHASPYENLEIYKYSSQMYWYDSPNEYFVGVITAILGIFTFNTYLPTAVLFGYISFTGVWAMFRTFAINYPDYVKPLAIAFLFIPSTVIWGSGIFKDTICIFALGWMTYSTFRIFANRDLSLKNIFFFIGSFFLIASVKLYILLGFLPALSLWLLLMYSKRITIPALRWLTSIFFLSITIGAFFFFSQLFAKELNKYSLEKISETAELTRGWTNYAAGEEGSIYSIGKLDGSVVNLLKLFPQGIVVTLFRPFPWEVKKIIVLLTSIEALALVYFTLLMFFSRKAKPIKTLFKDPNVLFALVFSLIFSFAVGVSSGNFGALSRYKIPALPFYGAVLAIMLGEKYRKSNSTVKSKAVDYKKFI